MIKRIPSLIILLWFASALSAQTDLYGNEWISYDQQYLKIRTAADGLYRLHYDELADALTAIGTDIATIAPDDFQLFQLGEEQYLYIEGDGDGSFDPGDFIEFYGIRNDGKLDTRLYENEQYQIHTYTSLFTDTAVYFLTWNSDPGHLRMEQLANVLSDMPEPESHYEFRTLMINGSTTVLNHGASYFAPGRYYLEIYSSKYDDGEGFSETRFAGTTRNKTLSTSNIYSGEDAFVPTLRTAVIATNEVEHHYTISFNGTTLYDTSFTGYDFKKYEFSIDNLLSSNTVSFASLNGSNDYLRNCYIEITYPRIWDFNNASKVGLRLVNSLSATKYLVITDFNEKSTDPVIWDFDDHKRMIGTIVGSNTEIHMPYDASGNRIWLSSQDTLDILQVQELEPVTFIDFNNPVNQGDYLIISHAGLRDDGTGEDWIQAYADYREGFAGGSFQPLIADIAQLTDQFAYGIKTHPLAVRNFVFFAEDHFETDPRYLFLIGKARKYDGCRNNAESFAQNTVPTFGNPGSDVLLVCRPGSYIPELPVGRLVAYNGTEVKNYLDKVVEYETVQATTDQTIESKAWMKNMLHFAGGLNEYEQSLFNTYLRNLGDIAEDTLYGANVIQFNKITTDPIFYETSDYIDSLINSGVSLVTFFGHSTTGSFDYNIGDPEDFTNYGKYNVIFGNGCNTAAIFDGTITLGEKYINTEDRASIAFIAATTFSLAGSLYNYGLRFYAELSRYRYGQGIGDALQGAAEYISAFDNIYDLLTLQHTALQGDPALRLNTHSLPDYVIEEPYVFFEPSVITTLEDSFTVQVVVTNIGMAIDKDYTVSVERIRPDGSSELVTRTLRSAQFRDTVGIRLFTDANSGVGLNSFTITVDYGDSIAEIAEWNNVISKTQLILGDDANPVYPYEFALINEAPDYLAASTSNPFAGTRTYVMQIDTTASFNSPLLQSHSVTQSGGVLKWEAPPVTWLSGRVYYWRVSVDTAGGADYLWRTSSFRYKSGEEIGWNQSHYFQYADDLYDNISLDEDRNFHFVNNYVNYQVATGIYPTTDWTEVTSYLNGEEMAVGSCANNGFVVFVIDPVSGYPWQVSEVDDSGFGPYGDIYCSADAYEQIIQFSTADLESRTAFYHFMKDSVPDGTYFLCYSNNYPQFNEWLDDTLSLGGESLFDAFNEYGAVMINDLAVYDFDRSYIFYAKKGEPASAFEIIGDTLGNKIDAVVNISGLWDEGSYTSERIGPAAAWDQVKWNYEAPDSEADSVYLEVLGEDEYGMQTILSSGLVSGDTTISWIDANMYPYIRLRTNTFDDVVRTPAQLNEWQVIYTPLGEAALNAFADFSWQKDSIQQGEPLHFRVAVDNVSAWDLDSMLIAFTIQDAANVLHPVPFERQDSIRAFERLTADITIDTKDIPPGASTLIVEVNPPFDQPEQYHFNNIGYLPLHVSGDLSDPNIDVTFDGVHILDGDIVSASPAIVIALKDENTFLALSDTSLMQVSVKYPDGSVVPFAYHDGTLIFYPAETAATNNTARIEMNPDFSQDGLYELWVNGADVSGNSSGDGVDYRIGFEVVNKPMVSNVLTYPNPFTTQTRFVFTLTGSEVPDYIKVQILTVSGKVIREVLAPELGPLHIGTNITEFAWDGTDKFGDPVGNGLYLYRVVFRLDGQSLEHFDTGTDQYFESGLGKMYLAR